LETLSCKLFYVTMAVLLLLLCSSVPAITHAAHHKALRFWSGRQQLHQHLSHGTISAANMTGTPQLSSLHEVVGPDGVLVIHLERADRKEYKKLIEVGIQPTLFPAVDGRKAASDELDKACILHNHEKPDPTCTGFDRQPGGNRGEGCGDPVQQAIAESHRQAILAAQARNSTWTAILEDDVVPLNAEHFNEHFRAIWKQIPENVGFVRLGWCTFPTPGAEIEQSIYSTQGNFMIVDKLSQNNGKEGMWYHTGGCTTAYMIHRDIIPAVLRIFPCCAALDACYEHELFYWPPFCRQSNPATCWGEQHMVGIDTKNSNEVTKGWAYLTQNGIFAQDNRETSSTRIK